MKTRFLLLLFLGVSFAAHCQKYCNLASKAIQYTEDGRKEAGLGVTVSYEYTLAPKSI